MDPDAIWRMICESLHDLKKDPDNPDTRKHAIDCLQVLATWLYRGGFPPTLARVEQNVEQVHEPAVNDAARKTTHTKRRARYGTAKSKHQEPRKKH